MNEIKTSLNHQSANNLNNPAEFLAKLLEIISQIKKIESPNGLEIFAVNRSYEMVQYDQAVWFSVKSSGKLKVSSISNIPIVKQDVPLVNWLNSCGKTIVKLDKAKTICRLNPSDFPQKNSKVWADFDWANTLWVPIFDPKGKLSSGMWLTRKKPAFQNRDITLMEKLAEAYGYHKFFLSGDKAYKKKMLPMTKWTLLLLLILLGFCMMIPVRESSLASMEVRAKEPLIVTAPISASIKDIFILPNHLVKKGEELLSFDDTEIKSDYELSIKSIELAKERLRTVLQGSFGDDNAKAEVRLVRAELAKEIVVKNYKKQRYDLVKLSAPKSGLLIYTDKNDWIGRPVKVGEKIMTIADESKVEIIAKLPVADDFNIPENAEMKVFLNSNPLEPLDATMTSISFTAEATSANVIAYTVLADLSSDAKIPRIGSQGTAKIYGKQVLLGFYLFRKPISAIRQMLGL